MCAEYYHESCEDCGGQLKLAYRRKTEDLGCSAIYECADCQENYAIIIPPVCSKAIATAT